MGFKPMCCGLLGFWSFIGFLFYAISAIMVYNRNWVFLTHKAGMDQFTATEEDFYQKMMQMVFVSAVSILTPINPLIQIMLGSMLVCCLGSCCYQNREDKQNAEDKRAAEERARIAFAIQRE